MPKTYTIRLNSVDRLSGNINNATYNVNLFNILPDDVEYWKVQMYLSTQTGYYMDSIDTVGGGITDFGKAYVLMNCSTKALGGEAKINGGPTSYLGMARRIQTTQNINNAVPAVRGTSLAYYCADNINAPPVTIKKPADSFLQLTFLKPLLNDALTDTDNAGIAVADMTNYFMILSFTDADAM